MCCPEPSSGTINPSDAHTGRRRLRCSPYTSPSVACSTTCVGLPSCAVAPPLHAAPATPGDPMGRSRCPGPSTAAFPQRPKGRHLLISDEATRRFARATACNSARGYSQPLIAQTLHPVTGKVYGQLLPWDSNPLNQQPMTAYGQVLDSSASSVHRPCRRWIATSCRVAHAPRSNGPTAPRDDAFGELERFGGRR